MRKVFRMRIATACVALTLTVGGAMPVYSAYAEDIDSAGGVYLLEEGTITNPDAFNIAADINSRMMPEESPASGNDEWEGYTSGPLEFKPTWQNPKYVRRSRTPGMVSACSSTNYKVVSSSSPGRLGNSYIYQCWGGTGTYRGSSEMGHMGTYGATFVCPGKYSGRIETSYIYGGDGWTWSPWRGPHPNNNEKGSYCYAFTSLRRYRAIQLK